MGERVVTCMSGGVDSSVAAARLLDAGYEVIGVFMRSGASQHQSGEQQGCCSVEDAVDARRIADRLGIPFYALNMEQEFGRVMDRFAADYARGRTPNPCVLCNRWLKFGHVLRFARDVGATRIASGHYAQVERIGERYTLSRPVDMRKDQSYVLAVLEQEQLAALELPLGALTKDEVRNEAARRGFYRVAGKKDSQEICFVQSDYREFLRERLPADADALQPGSIVDGEGKELGQHAGTAGFTVGQRKGIGVAAAHPLYVHKTEPGRRLVVVGPRSGLGCSSLEAEEVTWLGAKLEPGERCPGRAQVRAHGAAHPGELEALDSGRVVFRFTDPVEAVVSGQAAVVYDPTDRYVLASGWIDRVEQGA